MMTNERRKFDSSLTRQVVTICFMKMQLAPFTHKIKIKFQNFSVHTIPLQTFFLEIRMLPMCKALESVRFVKPIFEAIPQGSIYIMSRHYTKEIYERARAVENAHFLKIVRNYNQKLIYIHTHIDVFTNDFLLWPQQTEQLKNLRNKIARESGLREHKVENSLQMKSQNTDSNRNLQKTQSVITQQADN